MAENKENEAVSVNDQIEQLKQQLEELTASHLHLTTIIEELLHEIKQRETDQDDVQVISSFNKDKEISAYVEENRTFIQSIWKRKK